MKFYGSNMANGVPEFDPFDKMKNAAGDRDSGDSENEQGRTPVSINAAAEMARSASAESKQGKYGQTVSRFEFGKR